MKRINQYIVPLLFIGVIFVFGALNLISFRQTLKSQNVSLKQMSTAKIEDSYRTSFAKKDNLIDVYGLVQQAFQKNIIGNFEFIKDNSGIMHKFAQHEDTSKFSSDMQTLKKKLDGQKIPLLYVQNPAREINGFTKFSEDVMSNGNSNLDNILADLNKDDIQSLDVRKEIAKGGYNPQNVYFKTDLHMQTETELWVLKMIVDELNQKDHLQFTNKSQILNLQNYSILSKSFLGNYGRSSGKYFTGLDTFNMYIPKFNTSLELVNPTGNIQKAGTFQDVIMNGSEKQTANNYSTYWVTNYLQWPSPYYEITNNQVKDNKILIIMDSMGLRTASYLSLMVHNLTVVDPRYLGKTDYIDQVLSKQHYDAVIVLQGDSTTLVPSGLFPDILLNPQAEIISTTTPTQIERGKMYDVNITVKNTGTESWSEKQMIRLCIFQDGKDTGCRVKLPDGVEVKPGEQYTFTLQNFRAPPSNSTYLEYQMAEEGIQYFGQKPRVDVKVK